MHKILFADQVIKSTKTKFKNQNFV